MDKVGGEQSAAGSDHLLISATLQMAFLSALSSAVWSLVTLRKQFLEMFGLSPSKSLEREKQ
jgi:hypothetical protein